MRQDRDAAGTAKGISSINCSLDIEHWLPTDFPRVDHTVDEVFQPGLCIPYLLGS